jgi:hypothetical protein
MIPLAVTYFAQYTISQGLAEFSIFDCKHAFNLDIKSQYRWYQVKFVKIVSKTLQKTPFKIFESDLL